MLRTSNPSRSFWLTILALTFIVNLVAARLSYFRWNELGVDLVRSVWGILAAVYLGMLLACIVLFILVARGNLQFDISSRFKFFESDNQIICALSWLIFFAILIGIPYIKFTFQIGRDDTNPLMVDATLMSIIYYWMCWYVLLLAMAALKIALKTTWQVGLTSALVLLGVTYEILIRFNAVTTYPLSMGWSEGSRYYYASLYFSKWIYGESVPLSTLHPSRYFLQSIPFLIPGLGITAHRFWQFLLWTDRWRCHHTCESSFSCPREGREMAICWRGVSISLTRGDLLSSGSNGNSAFAVCIGETSMAVVGSSYLCFSMGRDQ
jgi:hypothetical protein